MMDQQRLFIINLKHWQPEQEEVSNNNRHEKFMWISLCNRSDHCGGSKPDQKTRFLYDGNTACISAIGVLRRPSTKVERKNNSYEYRGYKSNFR